MWVIENPATGLLKTRPFMERLPWVLKGGLDSWGVSVKGLGGSRASCFIAFLRRCARRLRERPRQSLRIGGASRTEARGISYMSFFPLAGMRSDGGQ